MTKDEASKLGHGLYRFYWKNGGSSLASVGSRADGTRWFAPTNWINSKGEGIGSSDWAAVDHTVLIRPG